MFFRINSSPTLFHNSDKMMPSMSPSPPPSKEPPDKTPQKRLLSTLQPTLDTSINETDQIQPTASPTQRPPFTFFFTLITDTTTSTTHHPRNVHYIFSDDDPSLLTAACLEALAPLSTTSSPARFQAHPNQSPSSSSTTSKSISSSTAIHDPVGQRTRPDRENRILVLDLDASGTAVTRGHSLSSSWQILSTALTPAPTWAESPSEPYASPSPNAPAFMLKISGTDGTLASAAPQTGLGIGRDEPGEGKEAGRGPTAELTEVEFQALMQDFDQKMKVLRTVVEAGNDMGRLGEEDGDEGEKDGDGEAA